MEQCSYPGCCQPGHKHHIVFRSHGGLDNELNYKNLCVEHHEVGKDAPHQNRAVDVMYKQELQEQYFELFDKELYTVEDIAEYIGISVKKTFNAFLKVKITDGMYAKEDVIRRLMGGRLY